MIPAGCGWRCGAGRQALRLLHITLAVVALWALPGLSAERQPPTPLLWEVSDADNRVFLLGTFHLLTADDYPLDARVDAALDAADVVYFELAPEVMADPALGARFARAGQREDGRNLQQALDTPTWERVQALAGRSGIPIAALQRMEPWYAALTLSLAEMTAAGLDASLGLDKHLARRATAAGKRTAGLESPDDQIALFDGMKPSLQLAQLRDVVARSDELRAETAWLHAQWREGDADALYWGMAAAMKSRDPALYARLNTQRNARWVARIKAMLDAPGAPDALVAVGSLHLLGAEGLVQQLAAAGYAVERR